ncbi:MAG: hypothetical protein PHO64_00500 [Thiomonas sp.]|nr:hypothetical protein [Thiomonas sp.]
MAQTPEFKDFIPGMEFFQTLLKGTGMPSQFANWVAPTMDVEEIEQKITDLKAVLSWLETNARMTQNMIQALEVQRMTLHALKSMNVDLQTFANGLVAEPPPKAPAAAAAQGAEAGAKTAAQPEGEPPASPMFDPMQWWNTMTQQFTELASKALQERGAMQAGFGVPGQGSGSSEPGVATAGAAGQKAAAKPVGKTVGKTAGKTAKQATKSAPKKTAKPAARQAAQPARPAAKRA